MILVFCKQLFSQDFGSIWLFHMFLFSLQKSELALNQAMAYGKPVIATSADGTEIDLIQSGKNGYIIAEDNIPALANAITQIIQNPKEQQEIGEHSVRLMKEKFTLDNMGASFRLALKYQL